MLLVAIFKKNFVGGEGGDFFIWSICLGMVMLLSSKIVINLTWTYIVKEKHIDSAIAWNDMMFVYLPVCL